MNPDPETQPAAGVVIADRYRLVARVAGGGMGDVWNAIDDVLGRTVAIKFLRAEFIDDNSFRERLRREARAAGSISHAGVVPVYDYGEITSEGAPYLAFIVMEYVDGPSLSAELSELGPLGPQRTLQIIEQIAAALQAAHEAGIVHRDIKPGNILITPTGDVKIADFGISRASDASPITRTGVMTGTAKFLSPEQAGGKSATPASDIYSLGIVAYACLAGDVPFPHGNEVAIAIAHLHEQPPELPADVPAGLRELIMAMLQKSPRNRPASAGDVAAAAAKLRLGDPTAVGQHPFPMGTPASDVQRADPTGRTPLIDAATAGIAADAVLTTETPVVGTEATASFPAVETGVASQVAEEAVVPDEEAVVPDDDRPGSNRGRHMRSGVFALLLIAAVIALFMWWPGGTQVPNVVDKPRGEAETLLASAGLKAKFTTADVPRKRKDIVVEQSEGAGTRVDEDSVVTLTVASGMVKVPTDELLGETYEDAVLRLADLGLKASKRSVSSPKAPGTVIIVSPDSRAEVGSTVRLTVAVNVPATPTEPTEEGSDDERNGNGKETPKTPPTTAPTTPTTTAPTDEGDGD